MKTKVLNTKKPNPGSSEAIKIGCNCPVLDNNFGRGYYGSSTGFVYSINCPIHSSTISITNNGLEIE